MGRLLLAFCCSLTNAAYGAGIPTVDAGVIARQILAYQQQLRDFEIQLQQANLNNEQLSALNRQFSQTLKQYDDYLQQVRGLQRVISREGLARPVPDAQESIRHQPLLAHCTDRRDRQRRPGRHRRRGG